MILFDSEVIEKSYFYILFKRLVIEQLMEELNCSLVAYFGIIFQKSSLILNLGFQHEPEGVD